MEVIKRWAESPISNSKVDNAKYYPKLTKEEKEIAKRLKKRTCNF